MPKHSFHAVWRSWPMRGLVAVLLAGDLLCGNQVLARGQMPLPKLYKQGNYKGAIKAFRQVEQEHPEVPGLHYNMGNVPRPMGITPKPSRYIAGPFGWTRGTRTPISTWP